MSSYLVYGDVAGKSWFSTFFSYEAFGFLANLNYRHVFAHEFSYLFSAFTENLS